MTPRKCLSCGGMLLPGAPFCAFCGAHAPAETPPPERPKAAALPERGALSGPCLVLYAGDTEIDVRRVGRLVAEAVGRPLPDVTRELRNSRGIIAGGLEAARAVALAETIERELRAQLLVAPEVQGEEFPAPLRMRGVILGPEGLRCEAYAWDHTEEIEAGWSEVLLISCGRLELEETTESREEPPTRGSFLSRSVPELVTQKHYEYLLDMVLINPLRRLRLDQNTAAFSLTEMHLSPERMLGSLVRSALNIERFAQDVPRNRGVSLLASGASETAWEPLTFANKRDFDSYTRWITQLVRYGRPIPV